MSKQRITYHQLNLTQFVQGFAKNILEEQNPIFCESMLQYLADLMEDATHFSWANAKASHAVLLCEMKRGSLTWSDSHRIDRILRAHAQKHNPPQKSNWARNSEYKKPWYCKPYQSNACKFFKDHEVNGKVHRHICAHCLGQGRIMGHSEKECAFYKKQAKKTSKALLSLRAGAG